jgi:hypothetical protein
MIIMKEITKPAYIWAKEVQIAIGCKQLLIWSSGNLMKK